MAKLSKKENAQSTSVVGNDELLCNNPLKMNN